MPTTSEITNIVCIVKDSPLKMFVVKRKKGKIERKEAFSGCDNGGTCVASTRDFVFETFSGA